MSLTLLGLFLSVAIPFAIAVVVSLRYDTWRERTIIIRRLFLAMMVITIVIAVQVYILITLFVDLVAP